MSKPWVKAQSEINEGELELPDSFLGWSRDGMRRDLVRLFPATHYGGDGRGQDAVTNAVTLTEHALGPLRSATGTGTYFARFRGKVAYLKQGHRQRRREGVDPLSVPLRDRLALELRDPLACRVVKPGEGVGIELEYLVNGTGNIPADSMPGVDWGRDGSTHVLPGEHDLISPPERNEVRLFLRFGAWDRLERVIQHLKDYNGTSYATCGMHVHLDCRDVDREGAMERYKRLRSAVPWLMEVVATYRKESSYCKPNGSRSLPSRDRYMAVNWLAYDCHRTIECRFHHSTLDVRKIVRFVNLIRWVSRHTGNLPSLESFLGSSAPRTLKLWVLGRVIRLNPDTLKESEMLLSELVQPLEKAELPLTGEQLRYYKAMGPRRRR